MGIIEVKNLSFAYDESAKTIDEVSFSIEEGTYTTIIGHNGSGKSTIAKLIAGLLEKASGSIMVDGMELNVENLNKIRSDIGIVFQNPDNQFIGSTVRDDIAFGLENHCVPQEDNGPYHRRKRSSCWNDEVSKSRTYTIEWWTETAYTSRTRNLE